MVQFDDETTGAMNLAAMDIRKMYFTEERSRFHGLRQLGAKVLGVPGPKPKLKEITYRGPNPPSLQQFLLKAGVRESGLSQRALQTSGTSPVVL